MQIAKIANNEQLLNTVCKKNRQLKTLIRTKDSVVSISMALSDVISHVFIFTD